MPRVKKRDLQNAGGGRVLSYLGTGREKSESLLQTQLLVSGCSLGGIFFGPQEGRNNVGSFSEGKMPGNINSRSGGGRGEKGQFRIRTHYGGENAKVELTVRLFPRKGGCLAIASTHPRDVVSLPVGGRLTCRGSSQGKERRRHQSPNRQGPPKETLKKKTIGIGKMCLNKKRKRWGDQGGLCRSFTKR